jgi:putative chitinase
MDGRRNTPPMTTAGSLTPWRRPIGVDFVNHPDLALELDNATNIMFIGMIKGLFTSKSLSDYFNQTTEDWVNARKIINGLDKAQAIAMYGHNFYSALSYTT